MKMRGLTYRILTFCIACSMCSCRHKAIDAPYGAERVLNLTFEWEDAAADLPEGMAVLFYPLESGSLMWSFELAGCDGGKVSVPTGCYAVIAYSNDSRYIDFTGTDSPASFEASAWFMSDGLRRSPDRFYSARVERLEVTPCGVRYVDDSGQWKDCGMYRVRMYPDLMTVNYTVRVEDVKGLSRVRSVRASLSGLDGGCNLWTGTPIAGASAVDFSMAAAGNDVLEGCLRSFGTTVGCGNILKLLIGLSDGTAVEISRDVSRQIMNNKDCRNVLIILKGLDIPDSGQLPPIGSDVDVDGWTVVTIDISSEIQI